jgi:hypothetical protein
MTQWEYQITIHEIPVRQEGKAERTIECDQDGHCFVHDIFPGGVKWLEDLFRQKGNDGWELVQSGYHSRELLCIWKKRKETGEKV